MCAVGWRNCQNRQNLPTMGLGYNAQAGQQDTVQKAQCCPPKLYGTLLGSFAPTCKSAQIWAVRWFEAWGCWWLWNCTVTTAGLLARVGGFGVSKPLASPSMFQWLNSQATETTQSCFEPLTSVFCYLPFWMSVLGEQGFALTSGCIMHILDEHSYILKITFFFSKWKRGRGFR